MEIGKICFGILILFSLSINFNINSTQTRRFMIYEMPLYVNIPTFKFPKEDFLNSILYGRDDASFTYDDFFSSFGYKTNTIDYANIIIGNDRKLGGIALNNTTVLIPIPGSSITPIRVEDLPKFFPYNYTIFEAGDAVETYAWGRENATFLEDTLYLNADARLITGNLGSSSLNQYDFLVHTTSTNDNLAFHLVGYLKEFDPLLKNGILHANYYIIFNYTGGFWYESEFLNEKSDNNFYFDQTPDGKAKCKGSVLINFANKTGFYTFTGIYDYV